MTWTVGPSVRASLERITGGLAFSDPKTAHSRRRVSLTDVAIAALRRHRAAQIVDRMAAGSMQREAAAAMDAVLRR